MRIVKSPLNPQTYTSGLVTVYHTKNTAADGDLPVYALLPALSLPFETRKITDARFLAEAQTGQEIQKLIRCPRVSGIEPSGDRCMIAGDERQYVIKKVVDVPTTVPESMDLTLVIASDPYLIQEVEDNDPR